MSKSSRATHGETSAILQLRLRVTGLGEGLMTLTGTHPSPHRGVTTRPTITERGTVFDSLGSTTTVLPAEKRR